MKKIFLKGSVTKSGENKYRVLASTSAVDRQGDSIDQAGWDMTNYAANPVMLWAHDYSQLPVAKATNVEITDKGLEADFEFASEEGNPKAQQIKTLYDEGFLNAVSVGLLPKTRKGNVITSSELLEISFVPVPANQEALRLAVSNKSLDISLVEAEIEKGEVADVLDERDVQAKKYENLDKVWSVVSAFCSAYCDEAVPVEDFNKLLLETADLLTKVAGGEDVVPEEDAEEAEMAMKYFDIKLEKSGKVLSKKTLEKIDASIENMENATAALKELKAQATVEPDNQENAEAKSESTIEAAPYSIKELIDEVKGRSKIADKEIGLSLRAINNFIENR